MIKYTLIVIAVLSGLLFLAVKQSNFHKADAARQKENYEQSQKAVGEFNLTTKELVKSVSNLSGLTQDLIKTTGDIEIENITSITEVHNHYADTVHTVDTLIEDLTAPGIYPFNFKEECVTVYGKVDLTEPQTPKIEKDSITSDNEISIVGYMTREKHFWFIEWGPLHSNLKAESKCGDVKVTDINVKVAKRKRRK